MVTEDSLKKKKKSLRTRSPGGEEGPPAPLRASGSRGLSAVSTESLLLAVTCDMIPSNPGAQGGKPPRLPSVAPAAPPAPPTATNINKP